MAALPHLEFDTNKLPLRLHLTFSANPSAVPDIVDEVLRLSKPWIAPADTSSRSKQVFVNHWLTLSATGCKGDISKKIQICVACDETLEC
jgi:hypothetical protein